jgi:hypothetical protein
MRQSGTLIRTFLSGSTRHGQRHTQNGVSPLKHAAIRDCAGALRSLRWLACGYVTIRPQDWINVNVVPQRVGS